MASAAFFYTQEKETKMEIYKISMYDALKKGINAYCELTENMLVHYSSLLIVGLENPTINRTSWFSEPIEVKWTGNFRSWVELAISKCDEPILYENEIYMSEKWVRKKPHWTKYFKEIS